MLPCRIPPLTYPSPRTALQVHTVGAPERADVEAFVRQVYRDRFGAEVQHFAPVLVSLRDEAGNVVAAAGYRPADSGALFLERYLADPVELPLAAPRASIVEVGHLSASRAGEGRRLILLLGPHLASLGFHWVVSTLTEELRQMFRRLGVVPRALGTADPALLGADAGAWGQYYDHHPLVVAGQIGLALSAMAGRSTPVVPL